jgi:hypothetical protein
VSVFEQYLVPKRPGSEADDLRARRKEIEDRRESDRVQGIAERDRRETEDRIAREEAARKQQATQQREWAEERDRLRRELSNAEAARSVVLGPALDLSSPDGALEAVRNMCLRDAAERLVRDAERRLDAHRAPQRR